jgi:hypothetical protein
MTPREFTDEERLLLARMSKGGQAARLPHGFVWHIDEEGKVHIGDEPSQLTAIPRVGTKATLYLPYTECLQEQLTEVTRRLNGETDDAHRFPAVPLEQAAAWLGAMVEQFVEWSAEDIASVDHLINFFDAVGRMLEAHRARLAP